MARLVLIKGDITKQKVDAVVNPTKNTLEETEGVDTAIFNAGGPAVKEACQEILSKRKGKGIKKGEAVITTAGKLPARFVIHTAGPAWKGGSKGEAAMLAECYRNSLALANEYCLTSVAFPNISTGSLKYPKAEAAEIAIAIVRAYLEDYEITNVQEVKFVCQDDENFQLYRQRMKGEMVEVS